MSGVIEIGLCRMSARRVVAVMKWKAVQRQFLAALDALFATRRDRAFPGEFLPARLSLLQPQNPTSKS